MTSQLIAAAEALADVVRDQNQDDSHDPDTARLLAQLDKAVADAHDLAALVRSALRGAEIHLENLLRGASTYADEPAGSVAHTAQVHRLDAIRRALAAL